ncbi:MAG: hypothetical protein FWE61_02370 [Micrococcales bacterium]|nr:hypothetical protein [Micrococcales bacterium]
MSKEPFTRDELLNMAQVESNMLQRDFSPADREAVVELLDTITLAHVMAESEYNWRNTRLAVLELAHGDVDQVAQLVQCAQRDFRDVIYWAVLPPTKHSRR